MVERDALEKRCPSFRIEGSNPSLSEVSFIFTKIMEARNIWEKVKGKINAQWIVCRTISDRKSVMYGLRFSYPMNILLVVLGIMMQNLYILSLAFVFAFLGNRLPMHPLDYVYNYLASIFSFLREIPGRGSELQVSSLVNLLFLIIVCLLVILNANIDYMVLSSIYVFFSGFFICIFLFKK